MTDPLQALLAAGALPTTSFPPTSRYAGVGITAWTPPADVGTEPAPVPYLRRRLCPPPERHALLHEYATAGGDRRDRVAAGELGDPELWWRIADANGVIDPSTLTEPVGRRLRITLPADVPGAPDA